MDSEKPLTISYSGSLDAYQPSKTNRIKKFFRDWFWTYKHDTVDASTRSAYYLIKAITLLKEKYRINPAELKVELWGNIHPLNEEQAKKEDVSAFFNFSGYLPKAESLKRL